MDWLELWVWFVGYVSMAWGAFKSATLSGTAMGLLLAQSAGTIVILLVLWGLWRFITRKRRRVAGKVSLLWDKIHYEFKPMGKDVAKLNSLIAREVSYQVEELFSCGMITLEEKDYVYTKIGKALGSEEMLAFARESKREQIKKRKASYKPIKFPEAKAKAKAAFAWATGHIRKSR
jgi:hypothetical protein